MYLSEALSLSTGFTNLCMMLENTEEPLKPSLDEKFAGNTGRGTFSGGVSVPLISSTGSTSLGILEEIALWLCTFT